MKKILVILGTLITTAVFGASYSETVAGAGTNSIVTGFLQVNSMLIQNGDSGAVGEIALFDAPSTAFTYTNAAYTNIAVSSPFTYTNIYTNFYGAYITNTYTIATNTITTYTGATNTYPTILKLTLPAGGYVNYLPASPLKVNFGILLTNTTNTTITVDYNKF